MRVRTTLTLALAVALTTAGCAGSSNEQPATQAIQVPGVDIPSLDALPEQQRAAFEDGKITVAEYADAFDAWEGCANAGGRKAIASVIHDPVSGYIDYGIDEAVGGDISDPTTSSGKCYYDNFRWVEIAWQATDPTYHEQIRQRDIDQYTGEILPCLQKHGVTAPSTVEPGTQQYIELVDEWVTKYLTSDGNCS